MSAFNDRDPFSADDRRAEIDELFAELCLDSVGAKPTDDAENETVPTEQAAKPEIPLDAGWEDPDDWEDPYTWEKPEKPAPRKAKKKEKKKKNPIARFFLGLIPRKGDSALEIVRKCVCVIALLVFLGSACVLLDDFVITPIRNGMLSDASRQRTVDPLTSDEAGYDGYPAGILEKLKKNYYHNHDLIGWIRYPSDSPYWHGVDYPVVQRPGDNDYYLTRDFDQNENKNGSIYMDYRCDYATPDSDCQVTFIYGHNMRSGQMFASLNQLLDSLSMARCSPTFTFSSLFEENQYKVFAVFNDDTAEAGRYDFLNQPAMSEEDFVRYIAEMRVRSWYNYSSVDVNVNDEIVLLYTCSNTYQTTMGSSGRTMVAARKVRPGESPAVDTSTITENESRVMPKVWYANKGLPLPAYYSSGVPSEYLDAVSRSALPTVATTTTKPAKTTTTTQPSKTTTTTTVTGEPEPDEPTPTEPDDDVIAPIAPTTHPTTPTTASTPTDPTDPTEPEPTEPEPTEPEPTEPEPIEPESTEPEPTEPAQADTAPPEDDTAPPEDDTADDVPAVASDE